MNNARKHFFSFALLTFFATAYIFTFSFVGPVFADQSLLESQTGFEEIQGVYNADDRPADIRAIIINIIRIVLGFLAVIFLVLMVIAGFKYMTAAGNEDQTKKAMSQITSSVIGLLIILASWVITTAVLRYLTRAVNNNLQIFEK